MALVYLEKWHGGGNDFLVDVVEQGAAPWWNAARARALCDRHRGVGADGFILATVGSEVGMTLYNADGSLAEMSGNGVRCLAAAVRRATHATWTTLDVHTSAGVRGVRLEMQSEDTGYGSVAMGAVTFGKPLEGTLGTAFVGNPHVVVRDDPSWSDAAREEMAAAWAEKVGGANVEFVTVLDSARVRARVIERGVGWTLACGTGACAIAAVLNRDGDVGTTVVVENPGGELTVTLTGADATLAGPVQFVGNVEWLAV